MGYQLVKHLESAQYNRKLFYLDRGAIDLPPIRNKSDIMPGSEARSLLTGEKWILNSQYQWMYVGANGETPSSSKDPEPVINGITVTPNTITVAPGATVSFDAEVSVTGDVSKAVTWKVSKASSKDTQISESGTLKIGADETVKSLTVTAISAVDSSITGSATVKVSESASNEPKLFGLSLTPDVITYTMRPPEWEYANLFTVLTNLSGVNLEGKNVEFATKIVGNTSDDTYPTYRDEGLLIGTIAVRIGKDEEAETLILQVTASIDGQSVSAQALINIVQPTADTPTYEEIVIYPEMPNIPMRPDRYIQLSARVIGKNNPSQEVSFYNLMPTLTEGTTAYVTKDGLVYTGNHTGLIMVGCYALADSQIASLRMIIVNEANADPEKEVIGVDLYPTLVTAVEGERQLFKAAVLGYNQVSQDIKWTLKGNKCTTTTLSDLGVLTIGVGEAGSVLRVIATSVADNTVYAEALVNVTEQKSEKDCCNVTVNVSGGGSGIEEIPTDNESGNYTRGMVDGKPEWKPVEKPDLTPYLRKTDAENTYATKAEVAQNETARDASDLEMFNRLTERIDKTIPRDLDSKNDHIVTDIRFENDGEDDVKYSVSCYFPNAEEAPAGYDGQLPRATQAQAGIMTAETYRNLEQAMQDIANLQSAGGDFIGCYDTKAEMDANVVKAITDGWDTGDFAYVIHDETHEEKMTCYLLNTQSKTFTFAFEFPIPQIDLSGYIPRDLDGRASLIVTGLKMNEVGNGINLVLSLYNPAESDDDVAHIDSQIILLPNASELKTGVLTKEDYAKFSEAYNKAREGGSFFGIVETEAELNISTIALTGPDFSKAKEGDFVIVLTDSQHNNVATMYHVVSTDPVTWEYMVDVYKNPDLSAYMTREEIQQAVADLLQMFATKDELAQAMQGMVSRYEMEEALRTLETSISENVYNAVNPLWERIAEMATKEELAQALTGLATEEYVNNAISALGQQLSQEFNEQISSQVQTAIQEANQYADQKLTEANQYTDSKLGEANQYTDSKFSEIQTEIAGKVSQEELNAAVEDLIPRGMDGAEPKLVMNTVFNEKDGKPYNTVNYYYPKLKKTETKDNNVPVVSDKQHGFMSPDMLAMLTKAASDIEDLQRAGGDFIGSYLDKAAADAAITKVIADGWDSGDFCYVLNDEGHEGKMTCYMLDTKLSKWTFAFEFPIPQIDLTGYIPRDLDGAAQNLITGFHWKQQAAMENNGDTELYFELDTYDPQAKMGPSLSGPVPLASETTGGVISSKTYVEIMKLIGESGKGGRLFGILEGLETLTTDIADILTEENAKAAIQDGAKDGDYVIILFQGDITLNQSQKIGHAAFGRPLFAILRGSDTAHPYFETHTIENGFGRIASVVEHVADITDEGIEAVQKMGFGGGDYIIVKNDEDHSGESSLYVLAWNGDSSGAYLSANYEMRLGGVTTPEGKIYLQQNPVIITINAEKKYAGYPDADSAIEMAMSDFVPTTAGVIAAIEKLNKYDFSGKDVIVNFATLNGCNGGMTIVGEAITRSATIYPYWFAGANSLKIVMGLMQYSTNKDYNTWPQGVPGQHPFTGFTAGLPSPTDMFKYWQDPVVALDNGVHIVENIGRGPYLEIKGVCPMPVSFGGCLPFQSDGQERYVISDGAEVSLMDNTLIMNSRDSVDTNTVPFSEMITVRDNGKLILPNNVCVLICGTKNWTSTGSFEGRTPFYLFTAKNNGIINRGHVNRWTNTESAIGTRSPSAILTIRMAIYTADSETHMGIEGIHCFQASHNGVISLLPYLEAYTHQTDYRGTPVVLDILTPRYPEAPGYLPVGDALVGGVIEVAKDCAPEGFAFDSASGGVIYRRDLDADVNAYRYKGDIIDRHLDMHDPRIIEPTDGFRVTESIDHPTPSEYYD